MNEIRLFVCCHKPAAVAEHPLLAPIQVGAALTQERFPGFLSDAEGDNISDRNRSCCELTAQYWAWKNSGADFCGFFHYRRYLYPDPGAKRPYRIEKDLSEPTLERLGYGVFADLNPRYDMILPLAEDMHVSVREHYAAAPHHHGKDLALMEDIVREKTPDCGEALETYLSGTEQYFGNIFIMRRDVFAAYCEWLFPLLEEFDRRADRTGYGEQEQRVDGYLAERLLGVFYTRMRESLKTLELPRVWSVPDGRTRLARQVENALLPPGTRRRSSVKKLWMRREHG